MLSVLVFCRGSGTDPERLAERTARTLAPLVGASVSGLVRDVQIAGPADHPLRILADAAGCFLAGGEDEANWLAAGIRAARGPFLLMIEAGSLPGLGFVDELVDVLDSPHPGAMRMRMAPTRLLHHVVPRTARCVGLFAPIARVRTAGQGTFDTLLRSVKPRRTLRVRAVRTV